MEEIPVKSSKSKEKHSDGNTGRYYCALLEKPARTFSPGVTTERLRLINMLSNKWVSGTVLRYYFFDKETDGQKVIFNDGSTQFRTWVGPKAQQDVVRKAFDVWKNVGIGINFEEVDDREDAEIRIGFMRGDGAWSWLGRDILDHGVNERTMNFGWDLTIPGEIDTAIHEIGHTLGFPHEHQNPLSGIEWNEEEVYKALGSPPNNWNRQTTFWNIIRKLNANEVEGTSWDPDSIMHYPFEKGLIVKPEEYSKGLKPPGGLSAKDKAWVKTLYPPLENKEEELKPAQSILLKIAAGGQRNFKITPKHTRYYKFQTFGTSDSVMILFEDDKGELRYRTGDDDSGEDTNAYFRIKLFKKRKYVLRVRLYYSDRPGETSVMMW